MTNNRTFLVISNNKSKYLIGNIFNIDFKNKIKLTKKLDLHPNDLQTD